MSLNVILKAEAKVGLVVFAAILVLIGVYWFLGALRLTTTSFPIYAIFSDAQKLDEGADVRMAGVKVGVVQSVALTSNSMARVNMLIWNNNKIPEDSEAQITRGGFIGDNYMEILPGSSSKYLKSGSRIRTKQQVEMEKLIGDASQLLLELKKSAAGINQILGDREVIASVKQTILTLKTTAESASLLVQSAQNMIAQTSPEIQKVFGNIAQASEDATRITSSLEDIITKDTRPNIQAILTQAREAATGLNKSIEQAQDMISSMGAVSTQVGGTLAKLNIVAEQAEQIMMNLNQASGEIKNLAADKELQDNLKATLRNTSEATEQAKELVTSLNRKYGGIKPCTTPAQRDAIPEEGISTNSLWKIDEGKYRFDANYTFPGKESSFYRVGAYNIGENTKLNLQAGNTFGNGSAVRYGLYASRIGVGFDQRIGRPLLFSADVFRPNEPEVEVRGVLRLGESLGLYGGFTDVFDENKRDVLVGVRYQK